MGLNITKKILAEHLIEGILVPEREIAIRIDQTLTQDATGTLAYLQFQALGIPKVKTQLSVSYVDHNMLQTDFMNADDHKYLETVAAKYGVYFSKPGNGICHQVHRERFAVPGKTLLGSDSHTPTAGALAMIAIGAGGLDVAAAMAGSAFYLNTPKVLGVKISGALHDWVTGKDVILQLLKRLTVTGGVGKIIEYFGEGVKNLSMSDRFTITNMGAELGATTSIFPSDEITKEFMEQQGRGQDWNFFYADNDAEYDEVIELNLSELEPLIALPGSPDNIKTVKELQGLKVDQVLVGSCVNSSYRDLMIVAAMLKSKKINPKVTMGVAPGSKQVLEMVAQQGGITDMVMAGARILESACGFCIGMGQAPGTNQVSIRTGNRNFSGRSGTQNDNVYLTSPEVAALAALRGELTDPRNLGKAPQFSYPDAYNNDTTSIIPPSETPDIIEIKMGPNIKPLPLNIPFQDIINGEVLIKVGDNVTTDHIMPAGAKILPLRSNIPAISEFVFAYVDKDFVERCKKKKDQNIHGIIIGGDNYGQGSSREHAALAPMYLGVKAKLVKSFARIHKANLINFGILPLTFVNSSDYDAIDQGDNLSLENVKSSLEQGKNELILKNKTKNTEIKVKYELTNREINIIIKGGKLNYIKEEQEQVCSKEKLVLSLSVSLQKEKVSEIKGEIIQIINGKVKPVNFPIIPVIIGDGIGLDVTPQAVKVIDAAVKKVYGSSKSVVWGEIYAGEKALEKKGSYLPDETIEDIKKYKVVLKGPLTTPVSGGFRSLNVAIRQKLDLFSCVRPVKYMLGTPSPMKEPEKVDMVIFRENTEDVYAGIEYEKNSEEAKLLIEFLKTKFNADIRDDSSIGIKPISEFGSKRLVRAAIRYAVENKRKKITLVHKGNIMKFTEGYFKKWGYEVANEEFSDKIITEDKVDEEFDGKIPEGKIMINDRIADAMLQQVLLRPEEYDVIATTNLNGDYLSDAIAAQIGGIGIAPGANIGDDYAVFEATHGTAPKYAGKNKVNPGSVILSGAMMLDFLGWKEAADLIRMALEKTINSKKVTYDFARLIDDAEELSCSAFADTIIENMYSS